MTPIDTARALLAKESPELRRAVGELVLESQKAASAAMNAAEGDEGDYWCRRDVKFDSFARELIETKSEIKMDT